MQKENLSESLLNDVSLPPVKGYRLNPYKPTARSMEKKRGKRLTMPDQSLTIKQILERHTRGQRIPDQMVGYYDDENDPLELNGTNIETLDLSEKREILERVQDKTRRLRSRYNKQERDKYEEGIKTRAKAEAANEFSKAQADTQHKNP